MHGEKRTQREVADVAGVTEVTIRNRYKELLEELKLEKEIKKVKKKLVQQAAKAVPVAGQILEALSTISTVGRIGERVAGLMGYMVNPAGLELTKGVSPMETVFLAVGDPFKATLTSMAPTRVLSGERISITGTGLQGDPAKTWARIGNVKAEVVSQSATQIVLDVPASLASGTYTVSVQPTRAITASSISGLSVYSPPRFTLSPLEGYAPSANPSGKPYAGSETGCQISVDNLSTGLVTDFQVTFGGALVSHTLEGPYNDKYLSFAVPNVGGGEYPVVVRYTLGGVQYEAPALSFHVWGAPTIAELSPASIEPGFPIHVTGANLEVATLVVNGNAVVGTSGSLDASGTYHCVFTMPNTGEPGDSLPVELWTPIDMVSWTGVLAVLLLLK